MEDFTQVITHLLSGTAVEKNALELARLRKLPPNEQLEVGIVLREAMLQEEIPPERRQERLVKIRNVEDARRFLYCSQ